MRTQVSALELPAKESERGSISRIVPYHGVHFHTFEMDKTMKIGFSQRVLQYFKKIFPYYGRCPIFPVTVDGEKLFSVRSAVLLSVTGTLLFSLVVFWVLFFCLERFFVIAGLGIVRCCTMWTVSLVHLLPHSDYCLLHEHREDLLVERR